MLLPKRVKYRRVQRGRMTGKATRGNVVCQGQYGLVALEPAWISSTQIEAARVAMTRYIKRGGKVWIKIFPDKPVTEKPAGTRMGSGKGSPEYWVAVVKPGRTTLYEFGERGFRDFAGIEDQHRGNSRGNNRKNGSIHHEPAIDAATARSNWERGSGV